jgi:putative ABC transport system permease protein
MRLEHWLYTIPMRLRSLFRRRQMDQELEGELRDHVEQKTEEYVARGLPLAEARRRVLLEMGGFEQTKEKCREMRRVNYIENLVQDVRFGLRQLRRSPGFAAVAILSLAIGVGSSTALYSIIYGAFLHPFLKGNESSVLLRASFPYKSMTSWLFSVPEYLDIRDRTHVFSGVVAQREGEIVSLSDPPHVEGVWGARIPAEAFDEAGVPPLLGRAYTKEEDRPGGPQVVVLSADLWQTRYNSDPAIVGKTIHINGESYTVLGVMPKRYRWMGAELWYPLQLNLADTDRSHRFLFVTAGLRPGKTLEQARRELRAVAHSMEKQDGRATPEYADWSLDVLRVRDVIVGNLAPALFMLSGAVLLVLLITCANLANLTLGRAAVRRREMAVRLVHGASRWRLSRQMLTESLALSLLGSGAGVLVAYGGLQTMVGLIPRNYIAAQAEISVNDKVLVLTFFAALVMGLLIGLVPGLAARQVNLEENLRGASRSLAGEGAGRFFRRALVVSEIALAVVVLAGAVLMARSYSRLTALPLGFDQRGVYVTNVNLPVARYPDAARVSAFFDELVRRVEVLPGVQDATVVSQTPLAGWDVDTHDFLIEGRSVGPGGPPNADERIVGQDYFGLMHIDLLEGRFFHDSDRSGRMPVAIVNETMARLYWPCKSPLGARIRLEHGYSRARLLSATDAEGPWLTIVGVVKDARQRPDLLWEIRPEIDLPFLQSADRIRDLAFLVKTPAARAGILERIRGELQALDPDVPAYGFTSMNEIVAAAQGPRRLALVLLALFGGLALLLVIVGVYAVISYNVSQRTREMGLRVAMGAKPSDITRMILSQTARLAIVGVLVGVALATALTRLMSGLLYGVQATDAPTFATVAVVLTAVGLLAGYLPTRRATKVDPMVALRYE